MFCVVFCVVLYSTTQLYETVFFPLFFKKSIFEKTYSDKYNII